VDTQVLIIGGGATGTALARDLALRGVSCIVLERDDLNAGASGRNHGLLHSGARYVANDAEAAAECQVEGALLKRLAPQCIQDTGGLFVAVAGDDERYLADFPGLCAACGISAQALSAREARELEPALSLRTVAAYLVPDASIDPFRLSLEMMADAERLGGRLLRRTRVVGFERDRDRIVAVRVRHSLTGEERLLAAEVVVNAAGAWARGIARLAGLDAPMLYSKGTLVITHARLAQRVLNRLRAPGDADIIMPGGTVSIAGTTSVTVEDPNEAEPTVPEVDLIVEEAAALLPALLETRYIRAYAGVRPLVAAGSAVDGRGVSRGFALFDHAREGLANLVTITGGKLTTCRLMAERAADVVCARLGIAAPCRTRHEMLPATAESAWTEPGLAPRAWMRAQTPDDPLLCECEMISQRALDGLAATLARKDGGLLLADLGLRSRLGKGACQGTFCAVRAVARLAERGLLAGAGGLAEQQEFFRERWRGQRTVLWGEQLGQAELAEAIHCGLHSLELVLAPARGSPACGNGERKPPVTRAEEKTGRTPSSKNSSSHACGGRAQAPQPGETYDLAVVGAGLAGMSAAVFAANRGLRVVQMGNAGALLFSSGLFDLLGVYPVETGRVWSDPWAGLAALRRDLPGHPYAKLDAGQVRAAFAELVAALGEARLAYTAPGEVNHELLTGVGTVKATYCLPRSMEPGVAAMAQGASCLLVDFEGLREFSAKAVAAAAASRWPGLATLRLAFPAPGASGEAYAVHIAQTLEGRAARERLADLIRPHVGTARAVGLPAVLGLVRVGAAAAHLGEALGVPVFEVPTMPTSAPGLRLKNALERAVVLRGVDRRAHGRVAAVDRTGETFTLSMAATPPITLSARAVILATGRFMGGGLEASRRRVREPLLDLPVRQPAGRADWHRADLFDARGHALNRAGIEVDGGFRACDASGAVVHPRLFAVGTMLAHHDWVRMKCGAGLAIGTAAAAVARLAGELGRSGGPA
jgi:glycerol-3-phosphate dehydrogenase